MTIKEAANTLIGAYEHLFIQGGRACGKTALRTAILMGAKALMVLNQYRWERDVAEQLEKLGLGLGQKIDGVYIPQDKIDKMIKDILGEMYIDEQGNNVLNGGTEEYETKWKYEIGCNYGLQKAVRILKSYLDLKE